MGDARQVCSSGHYLKFNPAARRTFDEHQGCDFTSSIRLGIYRYGLAGEIMATGCLSSQSVRRYRRRCVCVSQNWRALAHPQVSDSFLIFFAMYTTTGTKRPSNTTKDSTTNKILCFQARKQVSFPLIKTKHQ